MMRHLIVLSVFLGLLVFSSCSKEDPFENHQIVQRHEFKLKKNDISAIYTTGFEYVYLDADMALTWTAASSDDWLSVSPSSGTGGTNICVTWQENTATSDREATITFKTPQMGGLTLTVKQGQKPAELLSSRAIVGNAIKNEKDSVEFVFDRPVGWVYVSSNSEFYAIDQQAEKMDDEGFRWRLPLTVSKLGNDIQLFVAYKSVSDWKEHKKGVAVPFYQKKYLIDEEYGWIIYSVVSLDKQSIWVAVDNWEADNRRLVQISLDDMKEMNSVKLPYAATHLCMNPYNGLLYVMGNQDYFCVVDPSKGEIVKTVQIVETSPYAHPQYPTNYASEVAFTNDGFGILRLISDGSTAMEWRYIDSANDDKITLSGYDWVEHEFEHLYTNFDGSRIYASMYPNIYSTMEWVNRQHQKPVKVNIKSNFNSQKYYAGGNLVDLQMSPFANKAFICTAPGSECVVGLEPVSYSEVLEEEARDSKCVWDEIMTEHDYVYQICCLDGCLELFDMTDGRGIFGTHHRFISNYEAKNSHFLPATDELVVSSTNGVWVFDAAAMKAKKLQ